MRLAASVLPKNAKKYCNMSSVSPSAGLLSRPRGYLYYKDDKENKEKTEKFFKIISKFFNI